MTLYKGKYRSETARLQGHNYGDEGAYFITINIYKRKALLGKIIDGRMMLSEFGRLVSEEWTRSFQIRKELFCEEWAIMPEHLHAIVTIDKSKVKARVESSVPVPEIGPDNKYGVAYRAPNSISSFVAGFKSAVTKKVNEIRNTPGQPFWQPRYHDHIIRNSGEMERIKRYIKDNPKNYKQ